MIRLLFTLLLLVWSTPSLCLSSASSARVVSMNLCADQIAFILADPGQLVSVSHLSRDPTISLIADKVSDLTINHGKAEEILRLSPDLILAGTYTSRASVNLLKRLGQNVVTISPAYSFADIRTNIATIGEAMGQEARADALIAKFDATLAEIERNSVKTDKVLASFGANQYTGGKNSLESEIVTMAGFRHLGSELGLYGMGSLPLEKLILANPDIVMIWDMWSDQDKDSKSRTLEARATEILLHPALTQWFGKERRISVDNRYWLCGTPFTLDAIGMIQKKTGNESQLETKARE